MENAGAELVSEQTLSDIYLDTQDLALLREDVWLRRRWVLVVSWWMPIFIL
jgi:inorganic triphosphatase YgiF